MPPAPIRFRTAIQGLRAALRGYLGSRGGPPGALRRRLFAAWVRLPPDRRSALTTVALLSALLAALIAYQRPLPAAGTPWPANPAAPAADRAAPLPDRAASAREYVAPARDQTSQPPLPTPAEAGPGPLLPAVAEPAPVDSGPLSPPLSGTAALGFGWAYFAGSGEWRLHPGLDLAGAPADPVRAAAGGTVVAVAADPLLGTTVILDHGDGRQTRYAGLGAVMVKPGERAARGSILGSLGPPGALEAEAGPHLHFELRVAGKAQDPAPHLSTR